ncbi:MAG: hypothetical protein V4580_17345 [Bacteroidota bacterium]
MTCELTTKKLVLILFSLITVQSFSCSCNYEFSEFTPVYLHQYTRIFTCSVISADTTDNQLIYTATVSKTYWGTRSYTVTITTPLIGGACGRRLDLRKSYLIYGNDRAGAVDIYSCSPTRELSGIQFNKTNGWDLRSRDSVNIPINGNYEKHTVKYLNNYFRKAGKLELMYLEEISNQVNGQLKTRFLNDTVSGVLNFKDGKLDSISTFYFPNGRLKEKGNFTQNSKEGMWTESIYKTVKGKNYHLAWTGLNKANKRRGKWKGEMLLGSYQEFSFYMHYMFDHDYE